MRQRLDLAPGDALILYTDGTDGVTAALNEEGEVIAVSLGGSAGETIDTICGALAAFTGGSEPADDVTVVVRRGEDQTLPTNLNVLSKTIRKLEP